MKPIHFSWLHIPEQQLILLFTTVPCTILKGSFEVRPMDLATPWTIIHMSLSLQDHHWSCFDAKARLPFKMVPGLTVKRSIVLHQHVLYNCHNFLVCYFITGSTQNG